MFDGCRALPYKHVLPNTAGPAGQMLSDQVVAGGGKGEISIDLGKTRRFAKDAVTLIDIGAAHHVMRLCPVNHRERGKYRLPE